MSRGSPAFYAGYWHAQCPETGEYLYWDGSSWCHEGPDRGSQGVELTICNHYGFQERHNGNLGRRQNDIYDA